MSQMQDIPVIACRLAIKRNEVLIPAATGVNLTMLCWRESQFAKDRVVCELADTKCPREATLWTEAGAWLPRGAWRKGSGC